MRTFVILSILQLVLFAGSVSAQFVINPDYELDKSAWSVNIETDQCEYVLGDQIDVHVIFTSDNQCKLPWFNLFLVVNHLSIHAGTIEGPELTVFRFPAEGMANDEPPTSRKDYRFDLIEFYQSPDISLEYGIRCIKPGHYVGQFTSEIKSPFFSFDIIDVPPGKETLWDTYRQIKILSAKRKQYPNYMLRTADTLVNAFLQEPPGQTWRFSALHATLLVLGIYRDEWHPADSIKCVTILKEILREPKYDTSQVILGIEASFCSGLKGWAQADALEQTVRAFDIPALVEPTQIYSDRIRGRHNKPKGNK